jgi:hypothetical protein
VITPINGFRGIPIFIFIPLIQIFNQIKNIVRKYRIVDKSLRQPYMMRSATIDKSKIQELGCIASIPHAHVNESFDPRSENLAQFTDQDIIQKFIQPIEQTLLVGHLNIF